MSWSSKQHISPEDQTSLVKDLLALSMKLEKQSRNPMDITKILEIMTQDIILNSSVKELSGFAKAIQTNGLRSKD